MMQFGFKKLLLISIAILVGMSVSLTSYFSYVKEEEALTALVIRENTEFVQQHAKIIYPSHFKMQILAPENCH